MRRARGLELRVLLNTASGFSVYLDAPVSKARAVKSALERCIAKGWMGAGPGGKLRLTPEGKEAAGLVLREVLLPPHLADLVGTESSKEHEDMKTEKEIQGLGRGELVELLLAAQLENEAMRRKHDSPALASAHELARALDVPVGTDLFQLRQLFEKVRETRAMVEELVRSMVPHPVEHPTIHAAWVKAKALLEADPCQP